MNLIRLTGPSAAVLKRLGRVVGASMAASHPALNVILELRNNAAGAKGATGHAHYVITVTREVKRWLH